jgi:hypothetical protein
VKLAGGRRRAVDAAVVIPSERSDAVVIPSERSMSRDLHLPAVHRRRAVAQCFELATVVLEVSAAVARSAAARAGWPIES